MDPTDITHRILKQVQEDLAALRGEVRENGRRIEDNGRRIDEVMGRLRAVERRIGDLVDITGRSMAR